MPPDARGNRGQAPGPDLGRRAREARARGRQARTRRATTRSNDLYDDADAQALRKRTNGPRLRRAGGRAILTYKGAARFQAGVKTREEREIEVSDAGGDRGDPRGPGPRAPLPLREAARGVELEGCLVALDETPIGNFVEVEGDPAAIRRV